MEMTSAAAVAAAAVAAGTPTGRAAAAAVTGPGHISVAPSPRHGGVSGGGGRPVRDDSAEHGERDRAVVEDRGVEVAEVEGGAEPGPGLFAQPQDLALPDQVAQCLAGKGDGAVDLGLDEVSRHGRVRERELPGLVPAPGAGRMIAWGGTPVGALLGGLRAELLPIRLAFGLLTISVTIGAGLAGWSCLGSGPQSAVSLSAPVSLRRTACPSSACRLI